MDEEAAAEQARLQWKRELELLSTDQIEAQIEIMDGLLVDAELDADDALKRQLAQTKMKRALFAGTLKDLTAKARGAGAGTFADLANQDAADPALELMAAIERGDLNGVQQARLSGADVNYVHRNTAGTFTPLYLAVMNDVSIDIVRFLLDQGADVHTEGAGEMTGRNAYILAQQNQSTEVLQLLVERGASPPSGQKSEAKEEEGNEMSVEQPAEWELVGIDKDDTRDDSMGDRDGSGEETVALERQESWMYQLQVDELRGSKSKDKKADKGATARANVDANEDANANVQRAQEQLNMRLWRCGGGQRIQQATRLLHQGADMEWKHPEQQTNVLMHAAETGQAEMVRFLVGHGADIGARDDHQRTALDLALRFKHVGGSEEVVGVLEAAGAQRGQGTARRTQRDRVLCVHKKAAKRSPPDKP